MTTNKAPTSRGLPKARFFYNTYNLGSNTEHVPIGKLSELGAGRKEKKKTPGQEILHAFLFLFLVPPIYTGLRIEGVCVSERDWVLVLSTTYLYLGVDWPGK